MITLIEYELKNQDINYLRIDGTINHEERNIKI